jgi:hypothetical protein
MKNLLTRFLLASLFLLSSAAPSWAVEFALAQAAMRTTTGTQDFTVAGFGTPKCAMFFASYGTANGTTVDEGMELIGFTDGTNHRGFSWISDDGPAASDTGRLASSTDPILTGTPAHVLDGTASFSTWITDGVRINWATDPPPSAYLLNVLLIGGAGVSNCFVGDVTMDLTVGNSVDVTAPGFQPEFVFFVTDANNSGGRQYRGMVVNDGASPPTQRSINKSESDAANPTSLTTSFDTNSVFSFHLSPFPEAEVNSFDASGFSVTTRVGIPAAAYVLKYMAVGLTGLSASLVTSASPTGNGDHTITGAGFTPQFALILHSSMAAVNTLYSDDNTEVTGISAITSASSLCSSTASDDNVTPANVESLTSNVATCLRKDAANFMTATHSAWTSDGETQNYTVANGTARQRAVLFVQAGASSNGGLHRRGF